MTPDDSILPPVDSDIVSRPAAVTSTLAGALFMASRGFRVFPIAPNSKEPLLAGVSWWGIATADETQIRKWFAEHPGMNYGVCPDDAHIFLDLDCSGDVLKPKNGIAELQRLESCQPVDEWISGQTLTVATPRGGRHISLRVPHAVSNAHGFPDGIDVRGARGYVVGAGSTVGGKPYRIVDDSPIIDAPGWVLAKLKRPGEQDERRDDPVFELDKPENIERARSFLAMRKPAVEGQGGNNWTFETAAWIRDACVSEGACLDLMNADGGWNSRCAPVWSDDELRTVVRNAYRYAQNRPGAHADHMAEYIETGFPDDAPANQKPGLPSNRWLGSALTLGEATEKIGKAEMVIREWLPARGFTAMLAKRGTGKSVSMLDMALTVATDGDWQGQPTQRGLWAFYLCGEDPEGTRDHALAWCARHGVDPNSTTLRFRFVPMVANLLDPEDTRAAAEYLRSILPAGARAVLFIDTWQRATAGGGQSRDEDMQAAVQHAEALARTLNGPAVIAFHPPKGADDTIIGSSVIENASAGIWRLTDDAGQRRLEVTRLKAKGEGNYRLMRFESQPIGDALDSFGQPVTGAVVVGVGGIEAFNHDDAKRRAWAETIRTTINETQEGPLSVNRLADLLAGKSYTVGSRPYSFNKGSTLRDELRTMFTNRPHDFGDGGRLELYVANARLTQFRLIPSPLDCAP